MKGQINVLYTIITIAIAFLLASGTFLFFRVFKTASYENIGDAGLDNIAQKLEREFLNLHAITTTANISSAEIKIAVPQRIGEQRYYVKGLGDGIELRTIGDPSRVRELQIDFWPSLTIEGLADSTKGSVTLRLLNSTHVMLQ